MNNQKSEKVESAHNSSAANCYDCNVDIVVICPNDPSAGLFEQQWEIKDIVINNESREEIRKATKEYFESYIACEYCNVYFSDEIDAMNKQCEPNESKQA